LIAELKNTGLIIAKSDTKKARKRPLAKISVLEFVSVVQTEIVNALGCAQHPFLVGAKLPMTKVNDAVRALISDKLNEIGQSDQALAVIDHERAALVPNQLVHQIADVALEQLRRQAGTCFADRESQVEAA
jgi:hypothetical protein